MRYGVIITGGAPAEQVELARAAEAAGWDGVFTWDGIHVGDDVAVHDPFAMLAAFAVATERVTLGAIIQPLSRRRPWEVARQTTTVDQLSGGRLVLPVGLGAVDDRGFGAVGETSDRRERAAKLDEALTILEGLWSGEPYAHDGTHFRFPAMAFTPTPVQRPRIPVWVVGVWNRPRSMGRALRWDGILPQTGPGPLTPETVAAVRAWVGERRSLDGYEIVVEGVTPSEDAAAAASEVEPFRAAGATWWIESNWSTWDVAPQRRRIEAGPPRTG
jgi:alkanesulfonate monooxygenase SsuD/methylene tetrahydromethanopterin reductase-like flavin-dependent oxidoreductase (luciferase family)